jgi:ABC-2 type transport system ATP-binding protein
LVGANGAGKTSALRSITGILRPSGGSVRIAGHDIEKEPVAAKRAFAYIPDTIHAYDLLTVREHLHFIALAYHVDQAEAKYDNLLEELELTSKRDEMASNLSRGMMQKLSLACAFLREPRVIILDEPLTGLDPRGIRNIKESIRNRAARGTRVLIIVTPIGASGGVVRPRPDFASRKENGFGIVGRDPGPGDTATKRRLSRRCSSRSRRKRTIFGRLLR